MRPLRLVVMLALGTAGALHADAPPAATPAAPTSDAVVAGQKLYARHCLSCHQADGGGVPNMQPAIAGGAWVQGDPDALALFVLTGGFDSTQRKDSAVDNVMPSFQQLADEDLAAILTYIRQNFGGGASGVDAAQVAAARAKIPK